MNGFYPIEVIERKCQKCGATVKTTSRSLKYCDTCRPEMKRKWAADSYAASQSRKQAACGN